MRLLCTLYRRTHTHTHTCEYICRRFGTHVVSVRPVLNVNTWMTWPQSKTHNHPSFTFPILAHHRRRRQFSGFFGSHRFFADFEFAAALEHTTMCGCVRAVEHICAPWLLLWHRLAVHSSAMVGISNNVWCRRTSTPFRRHIHLIFFRFIWRFLRRWWIFGYRFSWIIVKIIFFAENPTQRMGR